MTISCPNCTFENNSLMIVCEICEAHLRPHVRPSCSEDESVKLALKLTKRNNQEREDRALAGRLSRVSLDNRSLATVRTLVDIDAARAKASRVLDNKLPEGYIRCPHCVTIIEIVSVNCAIFTCGVYNGKQVGQHNEAAAQNLKKKSIALGDGLFLGCAMQFELVGGKPVKCTGK
jgi:hypothetical protein